MIANDEVVNLGHRLTELFSEDRISHDIQLERTYISPDNINDNHQNSIYTSANNESDHRDSDHTQSVTSNVEIIHNVNDTVSHDATSKNKNNVHNHNDSSESEATSLFECNICLDPAREPVITKCGHLYCWKCIYKWLHSSSNPSLTCPVCKGGVKTEELIPIYGRGGNSSKRGETQEDEIPNRPSGTRTEASPNPNFSQSQNGFLGGFMMGPDISLFPLPFFGMSFQFGQQNRRSQRAQIPREDPRMIEQRDFLKRLLIFISLIVFLCVINL